MPTKCRKVLGKELVLLILADLTVTVVTTDGTGP
jgi:hypothetical protein